MSVANNPLKQYFRRPAIYLRLPSEGKGYTPNVLTMPENGELPVYPMTAIDEITTRTPDALFNGVAMVDLIKSCVPDIKDPWGVTSVDIDALLIAIKAATQGNELDIESQCPSCGEAATYGINLVGLLSTFKSGDYSKELQINELSIKFRPLTYKEMNNTSLSQFELQRLFTILNQMEDSDEKLKKSQEAIRKITDVTMEVLASAIEFIRTPSINVTEYEYILDFIQNCDKNVYLAIRDYQAELKNQTSMKPLQVKCIHCQHEYEQPFTLNTSDFFE